MNFYLYLYTELSPSQGLLSQSADPSPDLAISLRKWLFFFMPDKCQYPFQQSAMSARVSEVLGSGPLKINSSILG